MQEAPMDKDDKFPHLIFILKADLGDGKAEKTMRHKSSHSSTKPLLGVMLMLLYCGGLCAQSENRLYMTIEESDNPAIVTLTLNLDNPSIALTATEAYFTLPVGAAIANEGELNAERCSESHGLTQGVVGGKFYASIASPSLDVFVNDNTPLCTWNVDVSSLSSGNYTIACDGFFAVGVDKNGNISSYTTDDTQLTFTINNIGTIIDNPAIQVGTLRICDLQGVELSHPERMKINIINGKKIFVK